jgi:hypothetical protein
MIVSLIIINNNELYVFEKDGFHFFLDSYINWFGGFCSNIQTITGNIVSQNWFPAE